MSHDDKVTVPAWDYGLPPAVVRLKARLQREWDRQRGQELVGTLNELLANQRKLVDLGQVLEQKDRVGLQ